MVGKNVVAMVERELAYSMCRLCPFYVSSCLPLSSASSRRFFVRKYPRLHRYPHHRVVSHRRAAQPSPPSECLPLQCIINCCLCRCLCLEPWPSCRGCRGDAAPLVHVSSPTNIEIVGRESCQQRWAKNARMCKQRTKQPILGAAVPGTHLIVPAACTYMYPAISDSSLLPSPRAMSDRSKTDDKRRAAFASGFHHFDHKWFEIIIVLQLAELSMGFVLFFSAVVR